MPIYRQVPRPPPRGVDSSNGHYPRMSVSVVVYPGLSLLLHVSEAPNSPRKTLGDLATLALQATNLARRSVSPARRRNGEEVRKRGGWRSRRQKMHLSPRSLALLARTPGVIARRRDIEHVTYDRYRVVGAAIFDEAESPARRKGTLRADARASR